MIQCIIECHFSRKKKTHLASFLKNTMLAARARLQSMRRVFTAEFQQPSFSVADEPPPPQPLKEGSSKKLVDSSHSACASAFDGWNGQMPPIPKSKRSPNLSSWSIKK